MLKRYVANKDATITNAYKSNLIIRGTGSNTGEADSLEVFHIYGQSSVTSSENSRILIQFPIDDILEDRNLNFIPVSGNVSFYLRMFNVKHPMTLPKKFYVTIQPISCSWEEGYGLDLDNYSDNGIVNWEQPQEGVFWNTEGGDYLSNFSYSYYFEKGYEDLEVNITDLVEQWCSNNINNYGIGIYLSSGSENALSSSYTKRFSARGSEFFFKKPIIEARWNDSINDDRGNFWRSSSLAPSQDNINTIYLYNRIRGRLSNIPEIGTGSIYVQLWSESESGSLISSSPITGGYVSPGIYSASFSTDNSYSYVYDRWYGNNLTNVYHTGTILMRSVISNDSNTYNSYVTSILNMKSSYSDYENIRFRLFIRQIDWCPNIYTRVVTDIQSEIIENSYYKIFCLADNVDVISYGTGSEQYTKLSYDVSGNYFDFNMNLLEPGYMYGIKFIYKIDDKYQEQKQIFKFRVD